MSRVCIVGLGKLGSVMAAVFAAAGHQVTGVDTNETVVGLVRYGRAPVQEPGLSDLMKKTKEHLTATTDIAAAVAETDIAFIIVPTPSREFGDFNPNAVVDAAQAVGAALKDQDRDYTVVVCSTVMPRACELLVQPALDAAAGRHVPLCYSPEFIALGSVIHDMRNPDMVLIGASDASAGVFLHDVIADVIETDSLFVHLSLMDAEVAKISVNSYVTMKISFANQLAAICERLPGANANDVAAAIGADTRIGPKYLKPGGPFGGPCFPRDNRAFQTLARSCGVEAPLAAATDEVNAQVIDRVISLLPSEAGVIAVLGLTYKPHTPVREEAFGDALVEALDEGSLLFHDPTQIGVMSAQETVDAADTVIVATPWPEYARLDYSDVITVIDVWDFITEHKNIVRVGVGP